MHPKAVVQLFQAQKSRRLLGIFFWVRKVRTVRTDLHRNRGPYNRKFLGMIFKVLGMFFKAFV
jgi:hypothetical protein